jgi:signal peptidase I
MFQKWIKNKTLNSALEWAVCIAGAFLLFLIINNFLFKVAKVDGSSMEPTLHHDDKIVVDRVSHFTGDFDYGDIIAFPFPGNPEQNYVKRIVAVAGDVVDVQEDAFYINGEKLEDDFSTEPINNNYDTEFPLTVPEGHVFVLGDNRNGSSDSRFKEVGCIKVEDIIGKTSLRIMPLDQIGLFN